MRYHTNKPRIHLAYYVSGAPHYSWPSRQITTGSRSCSGWSKVEDRRRDIIGRSSPSEQCHSNISSLRSAVPRSCPRMMEVQVKKPEVLSRGSKSYSPNAVITSAHSLTSFRKRRCMPLPFGNESSDSRDWSNKQVPYLCGLFENIA